MKRSRPLVSRNGRLGPSGFTPSKRGGRRKKKSVTEGEKKKKKSSGGNRKSSSRSSWSNADSKCC